MIKRSSGGVSVALSPSSDQAIAVDQLVRAKVTVIVGLRKLKRAVSGMVNNKAPDAPSNPAANGHVYRENSAEQFQFVASCSCIEFVAPIRVSIGWRAGQKPRELL